MLVFIQSVNSLIEQLIVLQLIKNMVLIDDLLVKECDILFHFFFVTIHLFDYVRLMFIESTITQSLPQ
jgi:hypothetical protein